MTNIGKVIRTLLKARMEVAIITLPEDGSKCGIRLLSDAEVSEASADAFAHLAKQCRARDIDPTAYMRVNDEAFDRAQKDQMTLRAFRDPEAHDRPLFPDVEEIRKLDTSYLNLLWDAYLDHQNRKAPAKVVDDANMDTLVASLIAEPESEYLLAQLDAGTLTRIVAHVLKTVRAAEAKTAE